MPANSGPWHTSFGLALAIVLSTVGCTTAATPSMNVANPTVDKTTSSSPTPSMPTENHPSPGSVYVEKDPLVASRPITIKVMHDGQVLPQPKDFAVGEAVRFQRSVSVGEYQILVNDQVCSGQFTVGLRQETDIALTESPPSCSIRTVAGHPDEEEHGFARLTGTVEGVPIGTPVTLRSIDDSPKPVPPAAETDEDGLFVFPLIGPGTYSVEVMVAGEFVAQQDVELHSGEVENVVLSSATEPP